MESDPLANYCGPYYRITLRLATVHDVAVVLYAAPEWEIAIGDRYDVLDEYYYCSIGNGCLVGGTARGNPTLSDDVWNPVESVLICPWNHSVDPVRL